MLKKIEQNLSLIPNYKNKRFLLTVSGGMDSMFLLHLFNEMKLNFGVAHCNFQLRGEESDLDEQLVEQNCTNTPYYIKKIDLSKHSSSTQIAARNTRYEWFNDLASNHQYDYIVTAHHLNDQIETFFINLSRGTGIEGLTGIKQFNGRIFRPLLNISREKIKEYVTNNNIVYREDSSNSSLKYKRNKIRHELIPILKKINPSFETTMGNNLAILEATNDIYSQTIDSHLSDGIIETNDNRFHIKSGKLLQLKQPQQHLFEFIRRFNFNASQAKSIYNIILTTHTPGKTFLSNTHKLVIDRKELIISPKSNLSNKAIEIKKEAKNVTYPINLSFEILPNNETKIKPDSNLAFLDCEKLEFPLKLRKWEKGDFFSPLGMTGKKKLSDFFIDKKLSVIDKDATYVLLSNNNIVWVVGQRISEHHKVTSGTKEALVITLKE